MKEKKLVDEVTIGQGTDEEPQATLFTVDWEDPALEDHVAESETKDLIPISFEEFLTAQQSDEQYPQWASPVGTPGSLLDYDRQGILCSCSPLDGAMQRVLSKGLQARLSYLFHYPQLSSHPGGT